ncbi:hypothetical protein [Bradyrhizobium yuanmingense]|uniref:hypothetical protein n=1 Tax=Bradyrhizobium yuanmingense TaxID=108015 RepID=UPI003CC67AD8
MHRSFSHHGRILVQLAATPESLRTQRSSSLGATADRTCARRQYNRKRSSRIKSTPKFREPAAADDDKSKNRGFGNRLRVDVDVCICTQVEG